MRALKMTYHDGRIGEPNVELSLFQPYTSKALHHEDHLTWAFLNLVKLSPMVLGTFVDMVAAQQRKMAMAIQSEHLAAQLQIIPALTQIPYATLTVQTQVNRISQTMGNLLSIIMTDDLWEQSVPVRASNRGARFDGLLSFDPGWVLVIENKPRVHDIWEQQLHPPLKSDSELEISPGAICVIWRELIWNLGSLVQRGLCQGVEAQLIEDFLSYIDSHFPKLNPFTTLGLCKGNPYLLRRRCKALMGDLGLGEVLHNRGFEDYVRLPAGSADRVYLYPDGSSGLRIDLYPADTVGQARDFLSKVNREAFLGLAAQGWSVEPHLHFSYISTHLHWSTTRLSAKEYLDYWIRNPKAFRQANKADLLGRLSIFVSEGLMTPEDVAEMDRLFVQTERTNANIIPGWKVVYRLPITEATALDERGQLVPYIKAQVVQALDTWGQSIGAPAAQG